jgi:hypothetical protein
MQRVKQRRVGSQRACGQPLCPPLKGIGITFANKAGKAQVGAACLNVAENMSLFLYAVNIYIHAYTRSNTWHGNGQARLAVRLSRCLPVFRTELWRALRDTISWEVVLSFHLLDRAHRGLV